MLAASNGVDQMCIICVVFVLKMELIQNMLILSDKVIDKLSVIAIVLFARTGEETNDNSREEVRSQVNMVDNSMDLLVRQKTLIQTLI